MSSKATSAFRQRRITSVSLPWKPTWEVPFFVMLALAILFVTMYAVVETSDGGIKRFKHFYRGDISAFLAEGWHISVPLFPVFSALLFKGIRARHPTRVPDTTVTSKDFAHDEVDAGHANTIARNIAGMSCVGIVGLSIVTQLDCTGLSNYPLQNNNGHGISMFFGFGMLFVYMFMHVGLLIYDLRVGTLTGNRTWAVAAVEAILAALALVNFLEWQAESSKEEFADDPKCDKENEWWCVLCVACFLATLPVLTQFCPCGTKSAAFEVVKDTEMLEVGTSLLEHREGSSEHSTCGS
eukprot:TRINITY_DN9036_c0_g9_i1.p1 TRINITY_DN9036_c0_g9~~TRINITY_DN9036_c0_g9_i1.p1  ORF type:complete len:296 (+),score=35.00 TRINITY_DN9036_c0_g9_i1:204-1091(+)